MYKIVNAFMDHLLQLHEQYINRHWQNADFLRGDVELQEEIQKTYNMNKKR